MDDLEIESKIVGGGTRMANSAVDIRFKVVEPNGITLIQNLFNAVTGAYRNAQQNQTNTTTDQQLLHLLQLLAHPIIYRHSIV